MIKMNDFVRHKTTGISGVVISIYTIGTYDDIKHADWYIDVRVETGNRNIQYETPMKNWVVVTPNDDQNID